MLLVRHNRLLPPFHDYASLTTDMLDRLASGDISPDIAPMPEKIPWDDQAFQHFREAEFFVCSGSNRTQQTCRALIERYNLEKKMVIDHDLNEIFFVPSRMMGHPSENPLEAVRKKLYSSLGAGKEGVEPLDTLHKRINSLLEKYESERCILFSHGFLIRLVSSYCLKGRDIGKALLDINQVLPVDYLGHIAV